MHGPMTVICNIGRLATLWHKDPERGGSDDSCGWAFPRLNDEQRRVIKNLAWWEKREPWFQKLNAKSMDDPVSAETLMRGAVQMVCRVLKLKATWGEICAWSCDFIQNPVSNFRSSLCHKPGYHTNFELDLESERELTAMGLFSGIAAHILQARRPWWRHPRWHVWHWRLQIHAIQQLKRWLFSRCCKCGKGFPWGYAPSTSNWNCVGPRWFRSEPDVYHSDCHRNDSPSPVMVAQKILRDES